MPIAIQAVDDRIVANNDLRVRPLKTVQPHVLRIAFLVHHANDNLPIGKIAKQFLKCLDRWRPKKRSAICKNEVSLVLKMD